MAGIITLLSDFGYKDHYVGVMKGVILSINPSVNIVDISHGVAPQNVIHGALLLNQAYAYFPPGTIHVAVVDPGVGTTRKPILICAENCYFVGPDNGIFGLIYPQLNKYTVYELTNKHYFLRPENSTFHGRDIFAPVAAHLSQGVSPAELGHEYRTFQSTSLPAPTMEQAILSGTIIYSDTFGNLVTNISSRYLPSPMGRGCLRVRAKGLAVSGICRNYEDVEKGNPLAIIGSFGLIELSVREGNASSLFGLREGDPVMVF